MKNIGTTLIENHHKNWCHEKDGEFTLGYQWNA